jgi:mannosylglycoprotein endo-beta-mannosidase
LVATFNDNYSTAYLHASVELENPSPNDILCSVNILVSLDVEDEYSSVEHFYSEKVSVRAGATTAYKFPAVSFHILMHTMRTDYVINFLPD